MNQEVSRSPDVSEWLVRRAAHRAPLELRERLEEEWCADLAERPGQLARLRFAFGCAWATQVIVAERPARLAAASAQGRVESGSAEQLAGLSRRTSSLVLVVGLHAALFYACWMSLATTHGAPKILDNILNLPVDRTLPPPDVRPSEPPRLSPIPIPTPEDPGVAVIESDPAAIVGEPVVDLPPSVIVPPAPPQHVVTRLSGAPGAGFPNVDDFYPAVAIRAQEQGGAVVQVCVDQRGLLTGDPSVVQSSGFSNLDAAAIRLAKAGSGHYRPGTEDGRAVASCFSYIARFRLKN